MDIVRRKLLVHYWHLKGLSQLHKQFVSSISLVQFNWYCKHRGDNDEELTWGRNLLNIYFFFLALSTCSRASRSLSRTRRCFRKEREENKNNIHVQARFNYTAQRQDQINDHSDQMNYF